MNQPREITGLLQAWSAGDDRALEELLPEVLDELRAVARLYLERERPGHTLQPTALVNELFVRLCGRHQLRWQNRTQFFGFAARTMRHILVDYARRRKRAKRGGGVVTLELDPEMIALDRGEVDLVSLNEALEELAKLDPEQGRLVEMRFFTGLTVEEIAELTGTSAATVNRRWASARAWLYRRLAEA